MGLRVALTHAFCWPEVRRGGERYLHELAGALVRRGHKVTIIAGARSPGIGTSEGARIVRLPRGSPTDTLAAERRFGAVATPVLAAGRFDVVHSLGVRDAVAALRSHPERRTVYTCLGLPFREWIKRPDGGAHLQVVNGVDVYGCLSRFAQVSLQDAYGRRGAITPGGVRLERFRPTVERAKEPTLLYSGAIDEPRKNVAALLEAVAILSRTEPRIRLWLSGPGDPTALLEAAPREARERTEVLPLGTPEDQPDRYAAAWATVYATKFEAFGLVLVESLACGTPIVASDHASLPELIEAGTGVISREGDIGDLARACADALALSQERDIRERCRAVAQRHDWDGGVAPAIEALYLGDAEDAG
jgi:glycosyltransferase involved in cell wall biosynthesis